MGQIGHMILQLHEAAGVEITLLPEEQVAISGVWVRLEKGRVVKKMEFQGLRSYEELAKKVAAKVPVAVVIQGKGVLHKKVAAGAGVGAARAAVGGDGGSASAGAGVGASRAGAGVGASRAGAGGTGTFEEALPNANPNDFFIETVELEGYAWLSIIRKDVLERVVGQVRELGFRVLSVSVGPGSIEYVAPFINFEKERVIRKDFFEVKVGEEGKIKDVAVASAAVEPKTEYNIGDQYVFASSLLAFSAAARLLADGMTGGGIGEWSGGGGGERSLTGGGIESAIIASERDEYRHYRYFVAGGWALMIIVFVVLLVNFLFYSFYFNRNAQLQTILAAYSQQSSSSEKMRAEIGSRQVFFEVNGWNRSSRLSLYADRIAGLVPSSAVLTSMKINPLNNGFFSDGSGAVFKRDTIQIAGTCDDPTELNRWVNNLRNIDQFRTVNLLNYSYKKESATGTFSMEITTK